jgi:hypothetical protein
LLENVLLPFEVAIFRQLNSQLATKVVFEGPRRKKRHLSPIRTRFMSLHEVGFKHRAVVDLFEESSAANFNAIELLIIDKKMEMFELAKYSQFHQHFLSTITPFSLRQ